MPNPIIRAIRLILRTIIVQIELLAHLLDRLEGERIEVPTRIHVKSEPE